MTPKKMEEGEPTPVRKRILEVGDDDAIRQLYARVCKSWGYDVIQARYGDEALTLYRECGPFVLVLTDLYWYDRIPEPPLSDTKTIRHGIQLALAIRKLAPEQKIALHTASSTLPGQMPTELGDVPILQKPFSIEELQSCLENL